jgi:hypothetical protein
VPIGVLVPSNFTERTLSTTPMRTVCTLRASSREYTPPELELAQAPNIKLKSVMPISLVLFMMRLLLLARLVSLAGSNLI